MKKGKKYVEAASKIEKGKSYTIDEAVSLVKQTATAKFDESFWMVLSHEEVSYAALIPSTGNNT